MVASHNYHNSIDSCRIMEFASKNGPSRTPLSVLILVRSPISKILDPPLHCIEYLISLHYNYCYDFGMLKKLTQCTLLGTILTPK